MVRGSFLHARLQIAVPHKCDRCIDLKEALVEPLSLCSTLRQDEGGPLPLVGAKNILGKQLAEFSCSRFIALTSAATRSRYASKDLSIPWSLRCPWRQR